MLQAARTIAYRRGHEDLVEKSIYQHGSMRDQKSHSEGRAMPKDVNLGIITRSYAPAQASLPQLTPTREAQQEARQQDQAREARRSQRSG